MTSSLAPSDPAETVHLTVVAGAAGLPLARVVAVSCGAQASLPMHRVEDLRQCTQEALAILLAHGCTGAVELRFGLDLGGLAVHTAGDGVGATRPDPTSFAWLLLDELADDAKADLQTDRVSVDFLITDRAGSEASARDRP